MEYIPVRATTLSPMQYHSYQMARGTKTARFIGDLSLAFALNEATGKMDNSRHYRGYPDYKGDLEDSHYYATVFKPEDVEHLPALTRITMQGAEWGLSKHPAEIMKMTKVIPSNTFGSYFQTQSVAPGSTFLGYILSEDGELPSTVRVGNQKEGLLKLERVEEDEIESVWVNLFTLREIFGLKKIMKTEEMEEEFVIKRYEILKNVDINLLKKWYPE